MVFAVGRLEGTEEVVGGEMEVDLVEDNLLEEFGQEGEVRDRPIVFQLVWVEVVFLEEGSDDSGFEDVRNRASVERDVDDVCDERQKMRKTVGVERGRQRVKFAGFEGHGLYGLQNLILRDRVEGGQWRARKGRIGRAGLRRQSVKFVTECLDFVRKIVGEDRRKFIFAVCGGERRVCGFTKKLVHGGVQSLGRGGGEIFVLEVLALGDRDKGADFGSRGRENLSVDSQSR